MNYIINILTPDANDGCSFYRAWGVFKDLRKSKNNLGCNIHLIEDRNINWRTLCNVDMLYMHRPISEAHLNILKIANELHIPVWIDYDDDLINIPEYHFDYWNFKSNANNIISLIQQADILSVSTEGLKDNLSVYRKDIRIIENYIPIDLTPNAHTPLQDGKFKIIWRGSRTHDMDWHTNIEDFKSFCAAINEEVELILLGHAPAELHTELKDVCKVTVYPVLEILDMFNFIKKIDANIGIVPLAPCKFNEAKSNIAWQEFLIGGKLAAVPDGWLKDRPRGLLNQLHHLYDIYKKGDLAIKSELLAELEILQYQKHLAKGEREKCFNKLMVASTPAVFARNSILSNIFSNRKNL